MIEEQQLHLQQERVAERERCREHEKIALDHLETQHAASMLEFKREQDRLLDDHKRRHADEIKQIKHEHELNVANAVRTMKISVMNEMKAELDLTQRQNEKKLRDEMHQIQVTFEDAEKVVSRIVFLLLVFH
jgi:gas vesicle protein